jgi:hypothetical protein
VIALLACSLGVLVLCAAVIRSVARARKERTPWHQGKRSRK